MKAVAMDTYGGREVLKVVDLPRPQPGPGEILVRVKAAGVNPVDYKIRQGLLKDRLPNRFPIIPGWDAAGMVEELGEGVARFAVGDAVYAYCRKPVIQHGTYAEYVAIPETFACAKPATLSFEEAAAIPLAGLTAYQSLIDAAELRPGQSVLIQACVGGVGGFAVQIAKIVGARVIGTASAPNHDHARALGADVVVDYTTQDFREAVRSFAAQGVDMAFDTVGGNVQAGSAECVKKGGVLVSILAYQEEARLQALGIRTRYVFVAPNAEQLAILARWADAGRLRPHLAAVLPMAQASRAHEMIESRHTRGKIVLQVA